MDNEPNDGRRDRRPGTMLAAGLAIGAGVGAAIGVALDNVAIGIPIGIGAGLAIGAALEQQSERLKKTSTPMSDSIQLRRVAGAGEWKRALWVPEPAQDGQMGSRFILRNGVG